MPPTAADAASADAPSTGGPAECLAAIATASPFAAYRLLGSSPRGLVEADADARLAELGENVLAEPVVTASARLVAALHSPFIALLAALAGVFALVDDLRGSITVTTMVLLAVVLRYWQQTRSESAVRALRPRAPDTVTVRRRARDDAGPMERELPWTDLVPGDLLLLAPGDVVPADVRVVAAADLRVDQAVITGESLPVPKRAAPDDATRGAPRPEESPALCLAGCAVVAGTATALVVATGQRTYSGALANPARRREESSFDRGVRSVSLLLVRVMAVMVPVVLVVNGSATGDWARAVLVATAVAVGLTPEMLPVIVTTTLARGARSLAARGVLVTRLNAVQDLAAADVVCLDKTGTLTEEWVVATHSIDATGGLDETAAAYAALAVSSQLGPDGPLDEAILRRPEGDDEELLDRALYRTVEEIGFDRARRRSAIVLRRADGERLTITKGDPDDVVPRCARLRVDGEAVDLDAAHRFQVADLVRAHARQGLRLLAVAVRTGRGAEPHGERDEHGMLLLGFVGFVEPVRASAAEAVRRLDEHGVRVLVLTGDNREVAARVAAAAGVPADEVALGTDVDAADGARLESLVERVSVFARMTPAQKARVVTALRGRGHAVGFVGDGVNDVAALQCADVGVAARTAAPAARRAADLVLTDPDLAVLAGGLVDGRRTLGNTLKYVTITASSNFGNALTVLAASVFLPFAPMLPLQLVVQNLLYDAAQLALPHDRVDPEYEARPRRWDVTGLVGFMLVFGALSSVFDLATFGVLWWWFDAGAHPAVFHAGWFVEGLLSQLAIVLVLRTRGSPLRRPPTRPVVLAALAAALTGCALVVSPWAGALGLAAPPPSYLAWLALAVPLYAVAGHLLKVVLRRRRRWWA